MAILKCKMCGGDLVIEPEMEFAIKKKTARRDALMATMSAMIAIRRVLTPLSDYA